MVCCEYKVGLEVQKQRVVVVGSPEDDVQHANKYHRLDDGGLNVT